MYVHILTLTLCLSIAYSNGSRIALENTSQPKVLFGQLATYQPAGQVNPPDNPKVYPQLRQRV